MNRELAFGADMHFLLDARMLCTLHPKNKEIGKTVIRL